MSRQSALAPSGAPRRAGHSAPKDESVVGRFLREEIYAPEKLPGNLSILVGVTMFMGGIAAVRTWGELMIPA